MTRKWEYRLAILVVLLVLLRSNLSGIPFGFSGPDHWEIQSNPELLLQMAREAQPGDFARLGWPEEGLEVVLCEDITFLNALFEKEPVVPYRMIVQDSDGVRAHLLLLAKRRPVTETLVVAEAAFAEFGQDAAALDAEAGYGRTLYHAHWDILTNRITLDNTVNADVLRVNEFFLAIVAAVLLLDGLRRAL